MVNSFLKATSTRKWSILAQNCYSITPRQFIFLQKVEKLPNILWHAIQDFSFENGACEVRCICKRKILISGTRWKQLAILHTRPTLIATLSLPLEGALFSFHFYIHVIAVIIYYDESKPLVSSLRINLLKQPTIRFQIIICLYCSAQY
jgi:hypothetical protein